MPTDDMKARLDAMVDIETQEYLEEHPDGWLPDDVALKYVALDLLRQLDERNEKIARFEEERAGERLWIACLIAASGGSISVPDDIVVSLDKNIMVTCEYQSLDRVTTYRISNFVSRAVLKGESHD